MFLNERRSLGYLCSNHLMGCILNLIPKLISFSIFWLMFLHYTVLPNLKLVVAFLFREGLGSGECSFMNTGLCYSCVPNKTRISSYGAWWLLWWNFSRFYLCLWKNVFLIKLLDVVAPNVHRVSEKKHLNAINKFICFLIDLFRFQTAIGLEEGSLKIFW